LGNPETNVKRRKVSDDVPDVVVATELAGIGWSMSSDTYHNEKVIRHNRLHSKLHLQVA